MSNPPVDQVRGSIKNLLLWLGFLAVFLSWGFAINELPDAIFQYYLPDLTRATDAQVMVRNTIVWYWPTLLVTTIAMFVFGILICRGARAEPDALRFRSRRVILSTMLLLIALYGIERITALVRLLLNGRTPPVAILLGLLFSLVWSIGSACGLFVWLRGYWEEHRGAQVAGITLTAMVVAALLVLSYGILYKIGPAP